MPFPSTEYDSVREFLREHGARAGGNILQPLLFQLGDGLIVGGRGERLDYTKDDTFESGLFAWNSLPALRLDGRLFVLGPLPKEQRVYECAGLASTVRKLFKAHIGAGKAAGGVTKVQLREIVQSIDSIDTNLDALRVQRIRSELERLGEQQAAFDALVTELMNHPNVMHRIDQDVKEEVTKQVEQKKDVQSDIARLLKERGEWEDRIRKQQTEHRKLREETSKVVKAAFEKARAHGVATFAELAIFQALSTTTAGPSISSQGHSSGPAMAAQPVVRELPPNDQDLVTVLRTYGVPGQRATALSEASKAAMNAGLMVCVTGVAARLVVENWARTLGRTPVVFDATVGLIDTNALTSLLDRTPTYDVLALLDANLSALDIYARQLSDLVLSRVARPNGEPQLAILLALGDGVGSLPLPKTFECVSISMDLEKQYEFPGASNLDELMATVNDPEEGILQKRLWRPAADRLRQQIENLDSEARARVLAILATR